ncbi:O-antigen ligase family protein [Bradyrhizobium canariense]|uniref:O-antigen ligase n=1 Tax=Bradyrhizobium canariense TaxID=255045 RepID=A0A1H1WSM6_9BRAD|nr:O-antigen ligase family protein [Bradyrhizobium canariense]SDT00052.1 O-antigen ligase [Bradyrhizobium canariense]
MKQRNLLLAGRPRDALNVTCTANPAKSGSVSLVVYAASACFLLQSMSFFGVIDKLVYGPVSFGRGGNEITVTVNLLGICVSIFLFWTGMRKTAVARFNKVLPLLAASLLLVSALWSVQPMLTLTQGTAYFFVVVGAIGIVQAVDRDDLIDLFSWACALSAVASLLWQFVLSPAPAFDGMEPDFAGIFTQKNVLGQVMAGGVLGALHGLRVGKGRFRSICIIALCTTVAFLSQSSTAMVVIAALLCFDFLGRLYFKGNASRAISICLFISCFLALFWLSANEDLIWEFLGKDATLTGRTQLWLYVIDSISEKPLFGWGFAAFWVPGNPVALQIGDAVNWTVVSAHNGLLGLLLDIGVVGASLFIFLWARNLVMALRCMNGPAQQFGLTSVLLLMTILLIATSEQVLLSPQHIWTALFFMTGFICEKELRLTVGVSRPKITSPATRRAVATSGSRSPLGR